MVNYLVVNDAVYSYSSIGAWFMRLRCFRVSLFAYLFLVWKGYFKNDVLNLWLGLLLVGSFGCLVMPFFALDYWSRWMFMLVYPFTFYAVYGLFRLFRSSNVRGKLSIRNSKRLAYVGLAVLFFLGCGYMVIPVLANTENMGIILTDVSLHFASTPSVPYEDVEGVTNAMEWLDVNMDNNSFAVLHHALLPWGQLYLDESHVKVEFWQNVDEAVDFGSSRGFSRAFSFGGTSPSVGIVFLFLKVLQCSGFWSHFSLCL